MADNVEEGPPRVFIGYVQGKLRAETEAVSERRSATFVDLTGDDTAYFALLERLWADGKGFLLLEEDVVPSVELLDDMWACSAEWCSGWFWLYGGEMESGESKPKRPQRYRVSSTLALHKFGTRLLARTPNAMPEAVARTLITPLDPPPGYVTRDAAGRPARFLRHWNQLDLILVNPDGILHGAPYFARPHLHGPVAQPTRVPPAWVGLVADDEWIQTGDYASVGAPERLARGPAPDQRDNHGAPFLAAAE